LSSTLSSDTICAGESAISMRIIQPNVNAQNEAISSDVAGLSG
jgi:hypothetical protein